MAGRIVLGLGNPALDEDGAVIEGSRLYFYISGTTTLQNIYDSKADAVGLVNPLDNPVIADAAGRFPDFWAPTPDEVDAAYTYSVQWTDAAGIPIRTFEDIAPIYVDDTGGTGEPGVYYLQDGPGVLDGTDVDVPALNGYIDTIVSAPGILKLPAATLAMSDKSLVLKQGAPLVGQGMDLTELDFSADTDWASSTGMITATGTGPGAWNPISVGVTKGQTKVTATGDLTPYIAQGHVMIRSTEWATPHIADIEKWIWTPSAAIVKGALTWANGNWYICTTAGTTAATAPTSTANPVTDGTAVLYYIDYSNSQEQQRWAASTAVALGAIRVDTSARMLICVTAGTTGTVTPAFSASSSLLLVTDNTVTWRYAGYYNATKGELKPYGVDRVSGSVIYLNEPIEDSYPLSYTGVTFTVEIAPVTLAEIELSDLTIRGSGYNPSSLSAVGSGTALYYTSSQLFDIGLQVKWCILTLRRVRFIDVEQFGWHRFCSVVRTFDCEYINAPAHIDSQQYGGFAQAAGDVYESNPFCVNSRHLNDGDGSASLSQDFYRGVPGAITVVGSKARGVWQSVVGNHRDSRRLVCTGFDWTVLTSGFKSRCYDYLLGDGMIVGPRYATSAEYIAQDGLVTVYYQGNRGSVSNVRVDGGVYGLRISDCDGSIDGVNIQMEITNALDYGARIGTAASDEFNNLNLDLNISGTITYDNILIDGTTDNSSFRLRYNGGRLGITNSNKKQAITRTSFDVSGVGCTNTPVELYNWSGGTLQTKSIQSSYDGVLVRLTDCVGVTYASGQITCASTFTSSAIKVDATLLSASQRVVVMPQTVISPSSTGTALEVSADVSSSDFHAVNTSCATRINAGANATNRYADAPNNVQDGAYIFAYQDMQCDGFNRTVTHTSGSAHAWTLNAGVFPVGARINYSNSGSGLVTLTRGAGIAIRLAGADANRVVAQYGGGSLVQIATDSWICQGAVLTT